MEKYDVIVVGGGFAGVGAAIAAAENGCKTLLIEKGGALGGAAAQALVMPYMPFFTDIKTDRGSKRQYLVRGIFERIRKSTYNYDYPNETRFDTEMLKCRLDEMVCQSGATVLFHSLVTRVQKEGARVSAVEISALGKCFWVAADCFVDATGDGNLCTAAGASFTLGREEDHLCQPMTLCFRLGGVDTQAMRAALPEIQAFYRQKQALGALINPREDILLFDTCLPGVVHLNSTRIIKLDPTDPFALSQAEITGRQQMLELFWLLRKNFPCFYNSFIVAGAASVGVRESRMITGDHILTADELKATTRFPDAIAAGNYDIDIHNPAGSGTSHYYFAPGTYYTIPYRSLCVKGFDNLLVAGRCISCTHEAQASVRIMPICCATGQAAGTAAALCTAERGTVREISYARLRQKLMEDGAFLGDGPA